MPLNKETNQTKKLQTTESRRKKRGFRTANPGKGSWHFRILVCIYIYSHRENSEKVLHSYKKMPTHLVIILAFQLPASEFHS